MKTVDFDVFKSIDMRSGRIIDIEDFPNAKKPAYKLKIDFGKLGVKKSSAQIVKIYRKEDLMWRI
jgi:tRNA-binding protein